MNDRTIIIENISKQLVGLADTQGRIYGLQPGQKIRLAKLTVQDILDVPGCKKIFDKGLTKIKNITKGELLSMGLTEDEAYRYAEIIEESAPVVIITDTINAEPVIAAEKENANATEEIVIVEVPTTNKPKTEKKPSTKNSSTSKKSAKK